MNAKYVKGPRVKIILTENQHLKLKYPELEQYVNEIGTVMDSSCKGDWVVQLTKANKREITNIMQIANLFINEIIVVLGEAIVNQEGEIWDWGWD